ncbi:MAG: ABC transporter permease subunit [Actinobacteria bacterium]|nr:ABC transporter permease subunit [Actinomycetota bacterium]
MLGRLPFNLRQSSILRYVFFGFSLSAFVVVSFYIFRRAPYDFFQLLTYTSYSILRIAASYVFSLIAAIALGFWMARNKRVERVLLPFLDIMQSVPVVGFFPAAIGIFVALFRGERIGIELASIFLIFTSQAWNMIFGVYESLKVMPKDVDRLLRAYNIRGWLALKKVYIPATIPSLIFNSNVSWGNSWFFLMSSEVFAIGAKQFNLPGIGQILWTSSEKGDYFGVLGGFLAIIITVLAMSIFVWEPLTSWSKKFSFQMMPYEEEAPENYVLSKFKDLIQFFSPIRRGFEEELKERIQKTTLTEILYSRFSKIQASKKLKRLLSLIVKILFFGFLAYLIFVLGKFLIYILTQPFPLEARNIPSFIFFSFIRLVSVYIFCLLLLSIISSILYFGSPKTSEGLLTIFRILSSIPGTALKPLILSIAIGSKFKHSMELAAFFVLFSTMFWYMIFPPASRIMLIPRELKEPIHLFSKSKFFILRKLVLPASFPGLVTGSFAAFGAGWNALVVAEFSVFNHKVYKVNGIGYLIDYAAIIKGDTTLLTLCLAALVTVIILLNNLIWQKLYDYAEKKYSLDLE